MTGYNMKNNVIAITNPYRWPFVRRGSERILNDLAVYLSGQGVAVETYSLAPESKTWQEGQITHHSIATKWHTRFRQWNECHYFAFALSSRLAQSRADVIHCLNYFDAYAAIIARKRYKLSCKIIFHAVGIPTKRYFRAVPLDAWFFSTTIRYADEVWVLSNFAQQQLKQDFNCSSALFPPPVFCTEFAENKPVNLFSTSPSLLFVGDCNEPRKGAALLARAFASIKRTYPEATLTYSGNVGEEVRLSILQQQGVSDVQNDIHFLGRGNVDDLPELYSNATVTVLPAVWEAFGLVVVESLMQGTPVVGCNHAGIPDIIDTYEIGQLFEPEMQNGLATNQQGLEAAILAVISSIGETTADACKQRAQAFSWAQLGPHYLNRYQALNNGVGL